MFFHFFQINETVTAFLSGSKDPHRILTFDWTTMEYTKHTSQLIGSRFLSACALLKGSEGEVLVAVASGASAGMEVWNPTDDSVKMLTSDFPPRTGEFPQLISVNDDSDLIFYESYSFSRAKGMTNNNLCYTSCFHLQDLLLTKETLFNHSHLKFYIVTDECRQH